MIHFYKRFFKISLKKKIIKQPQLLAVNVFYKKFYQFQNPSTNSLMLFNQGSIYNYCLATTQLTTMASYQLLYFFGKYTQANSITEYYHRGYQ